MSSDYRKLHSVVQLVLDCLGLSLIWRVTVYARILLNPVMQAHVTAAQARNWAPPLALILPLWIVLSLRLRLYRAPERINLWTTFVWAFENSVVVATVTAIVTFFSLQFGDLVSRVFVPLMIPISLALFLLARVCGIGLIRLAHRRYLRPLRVALVGDWGNAAALIQRLETMKVNTICGLIVPGNALIGSAPGPLPVLGTVERIAEVINTEKLDRVIVLNSTLLNAEMARCGEVLDRMNVPVTCVLDVAPDPVRLNLSSHYGLPFLEMIPVQFTRQQQVVKRAFDVVVSAAALVVLSPLLIAIAALIKLTSQGPVLYRSQRVGKGGRHFTFLKFRSMYINSHRNEVARANEKTGHIFKIRRDPRVTPIGRILRRYSLDELPQLINVLRGEMSIVGPRPLPAGDLGPDGMSQQFASWSEGRSCVHPGLTGLWQVSGRSDLPFEDMVRLDLAYIQNWSLALDARIIFDTPMLILRGVGAY